MCGIFGLYTSTPSFITPKMIQGLTHLQHRGQESAGMAYITSHDSTSPSCLEIYKNFGLVHQIFVDSLKDTPVHACIGHTRYSTTKKIVQSKIEEYRNIQPLYGTCSCGEFAIVHNGNIPNMEAAIHKLDLTAMTTSSDSEIFIKMIQKSTHPSFEKRLIELMDRIPGVYSLLILTKTACYGLRDRFGIRPLCLSQNVSEGLYCLSSESTYTGGCAYVRDIAHGEIVKLDTHGVSTIYLRKSDPLKFCLFEAIYFMKHTSLINNIEICTLRYTFGHKLGKCEDIISYGDYNTLVTDIPNTAIPSAKGYADALGLLYRAIFKKSHGTGRTFILPNNDSRYTTNRKGLNLKDGIDLKMYKDIVLVDDSLVRGNTIRAIIDKLKIYGIQRIHLRISSPPVKHPCYYGIDIPTHKELLAHRFTIPEIEKELNIISLRYLDIEQMATLFDQHICHSCFSGKYNSALTDW